MDDGKPHRRIIAPSEPDHRHCNPAERGDREENGSSIHRIMVSKSFELNTQCSAAVDGKKMQ